MYSPITCFGSFTLYFIYFQTLGVSGIDMDLVLWCTKFLHAKQWRTWSGRHEGGGLFWLIMVWSAYHSCQTSSITTCLQHFYKNYMVLCNKVHAIVNIEELAIFVRNILRFIYVCTPSVSPPGQLLELNSLQGCVTRKFYSRKFSLSNIMIVFTDHFIDGSF